jgi:hypothetical protein
MVSRLHALNDYSKLTTTQASNTPQIAISTLSTTAVTAVTSTIFANAEAADEAAEPIITREEDDALLDMVDQETAAMQAQRYKGDQRSHTRSKKRYACASDANKRSE